MQNKTMRYAALVLGSALFAMSANEAEHDVKYSVNLLQLGISSKNLAEAEAEADIEAEIEAEAEAEAELYSPLGAALGVIGPRGYYDPARDVNFKQNNLVNYSFPDSAFPIYSQAKAAY